MSMDTLQKAEQAAKDSLDLIQSARSAKSFAEHRLGMAWERACPEARGWIEKAMIVLEMEAPK